MRRFRIKIWQERYIPQVQIFNLFWVNFKISWNGEKYNIRYFCCSFNPSMEYAKGEIECYKELKYSKPEYKYYD